MVVGIIGFVIGLIGLTLAFLQWRRARMVERLRREQSIASIKRAKDLMIPGEVVERVIRDDGEEGRELMRRWLWTLQRGASDNYVTAVNNFLASEKRFTSQDLGRVIQAGIITKGWEEEVWRSLVALRPESRDAPALELGPDAAPAEARILDERRALENRSRREASEAAKAGDEAGERPLEVDAGERPPEPGLPPKRRKGPVKPGVQGRAGER